MTALLTDHDIAAVLDQLRSHNSGWRESEDSRGVFELPDEPSVANIRLVKVRPVVMDLFYCGGDSQACFTYNMRDDEIILVKQMRKLSMFRGADLKRAIDNVCGVGLATPVLTNDGEFLGHKFALFYTFSTALAVFDDCIYSSYAPWSSMYHYVDVFGPKTMEPDDGVAQY